MQKLRKTILYLLIPLLCLASAAPAFAIGLQAWANPPALPAGGSTSIAITVSNDGDAIMEQIQIGSAYSGISFNTAGASIAPGDSKTFTSAVTLGDATLGQPLLFDVTWAENGVPYSSTTSVIVEREAPSGLMATCTVDKTQASKGETVTLTYTLTSPGIYPIRVTSVLDKAIAGATPIAKNITIEPGVPQTFPYEFTMGSSTVVSAPVITYVDSAGVTQTLTLKENTLGMVMSKISFDVTQSEPTANGVTFTIKLTNSGNQKISGIRVFDEANQRVGDAEFALAVGEIRQLTYTVLTETERYVTFHITGKTPANEPYENNTQSYVVRKYIDPSLLGIDFSATVVEPLNAAGSIKLRFTINNTGALEMRNLIISEQAEAAQEGAQTPVRTEISRESSIPTGIYNTEQQVYVGSPRDLTFVITLEDPAGNPYTYTAHVSADVLGVYDGTGAQGAQQNVIENLGAKIGSGISRTLSIALLVLGVLIVLSLIALIILSRLERIQKREAARRRALRERQRRNARRSGSAEAETTLTGRAQPSAPPAAEADLSQTQIHRRPRELD
ncbi:MAG: hypothetical protein LBN26_02090 [Christensenellaceae bacterium]|jgi:hypothetical protein|nr:hypothetical protein [Christensenellaceae bacterium]